MSNSTSFLQTVVDRSVMQATEEKNVPNDWASRALYTDEQGGQNWLNVVGETGYPLRGDYRFNLHKNRLTAIRGLKPGTVISLGPGDGIDDLELVKALSDQSSKLRYIPVDLSNSLLELTHANLKEHVDVPIGVICDFETSQGFILNVLSDYENGNRLFWMLGGTIGNLDLGEALFFSKIRQLLRGEDLLLLDVPLAGPSWGAEDEPRLAHEGYSEMFKRFLGGAVRQWDPASSEEDIALQFTHRIKLYLQHDDDFNAKIIHVFDNYYDRLILRFRRYNWTSFLNWLKKAGFEIIFARTSITSDQDKFGMGVVLLSVKQMG